MSDAEQRIEEALEYIPKPDPDGGAVMVTADVIQRLRDILSPDPVEVEAGGLVFLKTGEMRLPCRDEWYCGSMGHPSLAHRDFNTSALFILRLLGRKDQIEALLAVRKMFDLASRDDAKSWDVLCDDGCDPGAVFFMIQAALEGVPAELDTKGGE